MKDPSERSECSFEKRLAVHWPLSNWQDVSVMVAVSGGPDSVALLLALHAMRRVAAQVRGRFEVAHFNHRWRGEASDEDERFVERLCERLNVQLHTHRAGFSNSDSRSEESARDERYAFLQHIAEQRGARYLVTAHTADDQAETIMHRILRGTGLRGLRGIQASRMLSEALTVIRPLLWARRSEVIDYLQRMDQSFRTDSSNADRKYTRNRIRADLLPKLADEYNPAIVDSLLRLGGLANETITELGLLVVARAAACSMGTSENVIDLELEQLAKESEFMQREIVLHLWRDRRWPEQGMSFEHWSRLVKSLGERTSLSLPGGIELRVSEKRAKLVRQG